MIGYLLGILLIVLVAAGWLGLGVVRRWRFRRRVATATRTFDRDRSALEQLFFETAGSSGKPRGLVWRQCDFHDGVLFAHDVAAAEVYALTGVTIRFEAIAGGDMEDVEAVGNLRCATAVFVHRNGGWTTDGRALFNLEPDEALDRYRESLQPLPAANN